MDVSNDHIAFRFKTLGPCRWRHFNPLTICNYQQVHTGWQTERSESLETLLPEPQIPHGNICLILCTTLLKSCKTYTVSSKFLYVPHTWHCNGTFRWRYNHVSTILSILDCVWNVMAHAQKPDFVFRRKGLVHLNRRGASVQSTAGSRGVRISGSNAR